MTMSMTDGGEIFRFEAEEKKKKSEGVQLR